MIKKIRNVASQLLIIIRENVPYLLIGLYLFQLDIIVITSSNIYLLTFAKFMAVVLLGTGAKAFYKLAIFGYKKAKLLQQ